MAKLTGTAYPRTTATNKTSAAITFNQRKRYDKFVFPEEHIPNMINFWGKDKYYGRLSPTGHPVRTNESRVKQIEYTEQGKTLYLIDFVADAWKDLVRAIDKLTASGAIRKSSPFSKLAATRAWSSCQDLYHEHMTSTIYPAMVDDLLSEVNFKRKVKNFPGFIKFAGFFIDRLANTGPVTFSGYLESEWVDPHISGLCVTIANDKHDVDFIKGDKYVYDESFRLYARTAYEHGFSIDKNAPWRLVADINSPIMWEYMRGVNTNPPLSANRVERDDCGDLLPPSDTPPVERYGSSSLVEALTRHAPGYAEFGNKSLFPLSSAPSADTGQKIIEVLFNSGTYFLPSTANDMQILKLYLFDFYNSFVEQNEVFSDYELRFSSSQDSLSASNLLGQDVDAAEGDVIREGRSVNCPSVLRTTLTIRRKINSNVIDNSTGQYGFKWMIRSYYNTRFIERNKKIPKEKHRQHLRHLYNIFYKSGQDQAAFDEVMKIFRSKMLGPLVQEVRDSSTEDNSENGTESPTNFFRQQALTATY